MNIPRSSSGCFLVGQLVRQSHYSDALCNLSCWVALSLHPTYNFKEENLTNNSELKIKPRPRETVSLQIPKDTLKSLQEVADYRDMSVEALLKFYIGQELRQDLAKLFSDRLLEKTARVLARHIQSEAEISAIIQEIKTETIP
jgi:hypothetical protein